MEQIYDSTEGKSGNRCGHNPANPRHFTPPSKHALRPKILQRIGKAVRDYFDSPKILPSLNAANGSTRQQRSERREGCCAILGAILHYTDLVTLRVGIPQQDGSMAGIPMESKDLDGGGRVVGLAELAGLDERRAERAIHDLKAAGIITVHPLCKKIEDNVYKGYAAIRTVSAKLFDAMGLGRWLAHERRTAKERRVKRTEKVRRKSQANVLMKLAAQRGHKAPDLEQALKDALDAGKATGQPVSVGHVFLAAMKEALSDPPPKPTG